MFNSTQASEQQPARLQRVWSSLPHAVDYKIMAKDARVMGANAMALPGGSIIVTHQLLDLLSADELLAVLAHEIGHVELQHGLRNIIQSLGATILLFTLVGDVGMLLESVLVAAPVVMQQMSYSRNMETEADAFAHQLFYSLRVSSACLNSALQKLNKSHKQVSVERQKWQDYLASYPRVKERMIAAQGPLCVPSEK